MVQLENQTLKSSIEIARKDAAAHRASQDPNINLGSFRPIGELFSLKVFQDSCCDFVGAEDTMCSEPVNFGVGR